MQHPKLRSLLFAFCSLKRQRNNGKCIFGAGLQFSVNMMNAYIFSHGLKKLQNKKR